MNPLSQLNPQQQQAVTAPVGPTLVLAGPGSGKTRVLTQRVAYLVSQLGVAPHHILAVTFTNKAAREMKNRVESLLEAAGGTRGLTIGTFHSICARLLRREAEFLPVSRDYVIFDDSDQEALVRQIVRDLNLNDKQYTPGRLLARISALKNELIGPDDFTPDSYRDEVVKRVYARYQTALQLNNALDFDDLLAGAVRLLDEQPAVLAKYQRFYAHLLVDEFQDTNTAQYALLRRLSATHRNLYVVGDPDQSVYRFRGADYRNIRRFQEDFPDARTILLEQNYRSSQVILDAAMAVIDRHPGRTRKQLFTERQGGLPVTAHEAYNEAEEAQFVIDTIATLTAQGQARPGDCAVMYRTNAQSRAVEEAFILANLPYRLVGAQRFYGRREVKDLLAYLRLIHNPADSVSLGRVINLPPRGIGAKTVEQLLTAAGQAGLSAAEVLRDLGQSGPDSRFAGLFTGRAGAALADFGRMLNYWIAAHSELSVLQLMDAVLDRIRYQAFLDDGSDEGVERWENVQELRNVAAEAAEMSLADFLEQVALVSDQDTLSDQTAAPTLLTLHAAKGLEFPVVFILGLDEGLLPHQRSFEDSEAMHEERRLFYVGMTRAKDQLYLLRAFRRTSHGSSDVAEPSRFLNDLPERLLAGNLARRSRPAIERFAQQTTAWETRPRGRPPTDLAPKNLPPASFRSGQRVRHAQFGEGIVIESKLSGGEEDVIIAFDAVGIKRLAVALANLELLKG